MPPPPHTQVFEQGVLQMPVSSFLTEWRTGHQFLLRRERSHQGISVCFVCLLRTQAPQRPGRADWLCFLFLHTPGHLHLPLQEEASGPQSQPKSLPAGAAEAKANREAKVSREREQSGHPPSDLKFNITYGTESGTKLAGQSLRMNACPLCNAQSLL